ncbi:MAG TPA: hypothetical protein VKX28_04495 [Xanthobacteraceae bacterium]|nr:hypothetical protein [Xanthobacteraceae bacterium]
MHGTLPISEDFALASLRDGRAERANVAALAREWGWSRDKVSQQLDAWRQNGDLPPGPKRRATRRKESAAPKKGALKAAPKAALPAAVSVPIAPVSVPIAPEVVPPAPVAAPPAAVAEPAAPVAAPGPAAVGPGRARRIGRLLGAITLAGVGIVLAGIGMVETTAFAVRVGGLLFAALAICADALVLVMPAAVAALWRRRSLGAIAAAALWLVGCAVSLANLSGYIGSSDDGFMAVRTSQALQRSLALEELARLRHERTAIVEMRPVKALQVALLHARRANQPALREALALAERRDALEAELSTFAAKLPTIPQIATVDPSANVLSEITGANISELNLRRLRLFLLLILPLCGGFAFSLALSLVRAPQARA